jgi:predicted deacylase
VGEAPDGTPRNVPVTIVAGRKAGPVVWINACAHGDEYGGARALQQVVAGLDPERMSGAVVAAMISNPAAFQGLQRTDPSLDDLMDVGDAYPGRPRFATERLAAVIHDAVTRSAAYFVDLHTGGDRFRQHPFILYTVTGTVPPQRVEALARGFGLPTLWRDAVKVFPSDAVIVLTAAGIPAFLVEVGGGQPLDPADIRLQAEAVRNFLRAVGVLSGAPPRLPGYAVVTGYQVVTSERGGFWDAAVKPGDRIKEGSVLGTITDVHGDVVETLRAPAGADIVLGVSTYPAAPTGGWLIELGTGLTETGPQPAF